MWPFQFRSEQKDGLKVTIKVTEEQALKLFDYIRDHGGKVKITEKHCGYIEYYGERADFQYFTD